MTCKYFFLGMIVSFLSLSTHATDWQQIQNDSKGQTVYFHAWGGSPEINQYLQWAKRELAKNHHIQLQHVKVSDISESIARLLAEKTANRNHGGSIDLLWINGENFKSLKDNQMLHGPFVESLPNWQLVDQSLPVTLDFTEPTLGLEAPWGMGQLVFIHDQSEIENPPKSFHELKQYAQQHPNRITYPKPPEFHGVSFLKALLIELSENDPRLKQPVSSQTYPQITENLWKYLDQLHPVAWRKGKQFPSGITEMQQLFDDGEIDLALSFNPNSVYASQAAGTLAETTKAYGFDAGALSNIHFLAVPWNANAKAGAQIVINFLLSPKAQSKKGDYEIWGDPAVIKNAHLNGSAKQFQPLKALDEPHPSWQTALENDWLKRYGNE